MTVGGVSGSSVSARDSRPETTPAPAPEASVLLPGPTELDGDCIVQLYALFAEDNREESASAKTTVTADMAAKARARAEQQAALERARKAQEEQTGLFDSLGLGSLAGIVAANPVLVLADVGMHMAKLTPDILEDFEESHRDAIEASAKIYSALGNASLVAGGLVSPESIGAAIALGGMLVQETDVLGREASDWAGTALLLSGGDRRAAATVVVADKDTAVADEIRDVEKETQEYTKWVAVAGMAVAAGAAIVGSLGTAAMPVVCVGVALSAAGFLSAETKCLEPLVGKESAMWISSGMMLGGSLMSGAGMANAATELASAGTRTLMHSVAQKVTVASSIANGAAKTREGLDGAGAAATAYEVDEAERVAHEHWLATQRLQRMVEEVIDNVRDLKSSFQRVSQVVNEAVETMCQTQLMAAGMRG